MLFSVLLWITIWRNSPATSWGIAYNLQEYTTKQTLSGYTTMLLPNLQSSTYNKLFYPTRTGKLVQSNLYISIASELGGAMLLMRLCIYRGFK